MTIPATNKHTVVPEASEAAHDYLDLDGIRVEVKSYAIFARATGLIEDGYGEYVSRSAWAEEVQR